ncbi:minor capsid protein [Aerococcaceae bacterium WGS1372]
MAKMTKAQKRAIRLDFKRQNKSHDKYWSDRIDDIFRYVDQRDVEYFKELEELYSDQALQIQKEIFNFYQKYADENEITLQEAKQRLRGEDLSDYRANANKYFKQAEDDKDPELLKRLNEQYRSARVTRLESLELDITYQLGLLRRTVEVTFADHLKQVATHSYRKIMGGRSTSTLNRPALEQLIKTPYNGYNYSLQLWGNVDNLAKDLKKTLTNGFVKGLNPREMAREIKNRYNVAKYRAETLLRTDGSMVVNNSVVQRYIDAGLTKYTILVNMDERTSDRCIEENKKKKVYLLKDAKVGINLPPLHFNCRSTIIPLEEELNVEFEFVS